jgi:hypothetical protein
MPPISCSRKKVWLELREQRRIVDHPSSPARLGRRRAVANEADVRDVSELLRLNYDCIVARHGMPANASA